MTVFLCETSLEGILSGVYTAWTSKKGHANVKLCLSANEDTLELFTQYIPVPADVIKAGKVVNAIREKLSEVAYQLVCKAALSKEKDRADQIYRFLIYGFHIGRGFVDMLQIPEVHQIFQMCRHIDNECCHLMGFVRFVEMEESLLVSKIGPKNDMLILLAPHFADRLSGENWVLYDENRRTAVLHPALRPWFLIDTVSPEWEGRLKKSSAEDEYEKLFQCFRKSVSIKERTNPACQLNHMPLRYRAYMPEFSRNLKEV